VGIRLREIPSITVIVVLNMVVKAAMVIIGLAQLPIEVV
jgi:hypothetical protein